MDSRFALEKDLQRGIRRAAALEERDREVEVDVAVERKHERRLAVVPRGDEALDAPRNDLVAARSVGRGAAGAVSAIA